MGFCVIVCLTLISASVALGSTEKIRYDGYHVVSVNIGNEKQRDFIEQLNGVRLLETPTLHHEVKLIVAPNDFNDIQTIFAEKGLVHRVETRNLQK